MEYGPGMALPIMPPLVELCSEFLASGTATFLGVAFLRVQSHSPCRIGPTHAYGVFAVFKPSAFLYYLIVSTFRYQASRGNHHRSPHTIVVPVLRPSRVSLDPPSYICPQSTALPSRRSNTNQCCIVRIRSRHEFMLRGRYLLVRLKSLLYGCLLL